jgi:hypothetical protein
MKKLGGKKVNMKRTQVIMALSFVLLLMLGLSARADWPEQDKLLASDGVAGDKIGTMASISGDYAIVGAHSYHNSAGAAYLFKREGTDWTEQQMMTGSGNNMLGKGVDISGDYAIVAAHWDVESTPGVCENIQARW